MQRWSLAAHQRRGTTASSAAAKAPTASATSSTTATAAAPAPPVIFSTRSSHVLQLCRHILVGALHDLHDAPCFSSVCSSVQEGDSEAFLSSPASSSNAVDIVLGVVGGIVVHHQTNTLDVKTTGCHVGCNQNLQFPRLQTAQGFIPRPLVLVAMDG
eukprot:Skav224265  [mRNA]  locus=scaffold2636:211941:218280:+ [translate_table: standard]